MLRIIALYILGAVALMGIPAIYQASSKWSRRDPEEQRKTVEKYTK